MAFQSEERILTQMFFAGWVDWWSVSSLPRRWVGPRRIQFSAWMRGNRCRGSAVSHKVFTVRRGGCSSVAASREAAALLAVGNKSVIGQIWDRQTGFKAQDLLEGRTG